MKERTTELLAKIKERAKGGKYEDYISICNSIKNIERIIKEEECRLSSEIKTLEHDVKIYKMTNVRHIEYLNRLQEWITSEWFVRGYIGEGCVVSHFVPYKNECVKIFYNSVGNLSHSGHTLVRIKDILEGAYYEKKEK